MKEPEDIKNINQRINDFKAAHLSSKHVPTEKQTDYSRTATGFQISTELLAGVLIGAGLGYLLDKVFSTQPWLMSIFIILGGAAGILNIYKAFKVEDKSKE